ncbi:XRE family transcriptional regulator [Streptomyces cellulosae]|uniref:XRE family transcriptional regulator n=1 Tax=Streptomyces cellulosae TaxID=1968 RepID=A0ABW7XVG8_STRCE
MVRTPLTPEEHGLGDRLGGLMPAARIRRSVAEVAASAGVSAGTVPEIGTGRAPTPAFVTVAAPADALGVSMDDLAGRCVPTGVAEGLAEAS